MLSGCGPRGARERKNGGGGAAWRGRAHGPGGAWGCGGERRRVAGEALVGSHLLRDSPTFQLPESDPEYTESVARTPDEFRVPLSGEHVACPPPECRAGGRGSGVYKASAEAQVGRGPASSQPAILKDCLTSPISVPGPGPLEPLGRACTLALLSSLVTGFPGGAQTLPNRLPGSPQGSGSMASGECVRVKGAGSLGQRSAGPSDLGKVAGFWGAARRAEPECGKTEGDVRSPWGLFPGPQRKPLIPGLPVF